MPARIVDLAHAVPETDIHATFIAWARDRLPERERAVFERMAARSGLAHRWSVLPDPTGPEGFYAAGMPRTSARMRLYAEHAPELALAAIGKLAASLDGVTHLVVASCTGFVAPGIDQIVARRLGLSPAVERLLIGFMGCYAGVTALKAARNIVLAEPSARVLVVAVELSTLHLQDDVGLEPLLAMLQFADGAAAALVTGGGAGLRLDRPFAVTLDNSHELITWTIGDTGFAMHLSGQVPARLQHALADPQVRERLLNGERADVWAVHAGGRSILDAVQAGLNLDEPALEASRDVLRAFGNMSSATLLFVLARLFHERPASGVALAFGPGLAAEGLTFGWTD